MNFRCETIKSTLVSKSVPNELQLANWPEGIKYRNLLYNKLIKYSKESRQVIFFKSLSPEPNMSGSESPQNECCNFQYLSRKIVIWYPLLCVVIACNSRARLSYDLCISETVFCYLKITTIDLK